MIPGAFSAPLLGGALIGLAATLLMLGLGRVAGVSGIVGGLLPPLERSALPWRIAFVAGLLGAPLAYRLSFDGGLVTTPVASIPVIVIGGICVGLGTVIGAGCTSGHGVCGLARLSARSLVAVLTFMLVAALTVFVSRHVLGIGA